MQMLTRVHTGRGIQCGPARRRRTPTSTRRAKERRTGTERRGRITRAIILRVRGRPLSTSNPPCTASFITFCPLRPPSAPHSLRPRPLFSAILLVSDRSLEKRSWCRTSTRCIIRFFPPVRLDADPTTSRSQRPRGECVNLPPTPSPHSVVGADCWPPKGARRLSHE